LPSPITDIFMNTRPDADLPEPYPLL